MMPTQQCSVIKGLELASERLFALLDLAEGFRVEPGILCHLLLSPVLQVVDFHPPEIDRVLLLEKALLRNPEFGFHHLRRHFVLHGLVRVGEVVAEQAGDAEVLPAAFEGSLEDEVGHPE